jgi:hypothetical protein
MKNKEIIGGIACVSLAVVLTGCVTLPAGPVGPASAYYVCAQGNDDNNGLTEETAFRTLLKAVGEATNDARPATITVIGTLDSKSEGLWTPGGSVFSINSGYKALITIRGKSDAEGDQKAALKNDVDGRRVVEIMGNANIHFEHIEISGGRSDAAGGGMALIGNVNVTAGEGTLITHNTSASSGGGVGLGASGIFTLEGGAVINNTAGGGADLKATYEAGKQGGNKGVAGAYTRDATGNDAGSWSRQ